MPSYENQHYLPCAYLRHFAAVQGRRNRDSKVWRTDAAVHKLRSVDAECSGAFFYSRTSATKVESEFQKGEDLYGRLIQKVSKHESPKNEREYFGLLVMMLDLHIRNAAYAMKPQENFDQYLVRTAAVRNQILFGDRGTPSTDDEVIDLWRQHWTVRIVEAAPGRTFISSDNPSLWLQSGEKFGLVHLVLLPVTPHAYAVGFDHRVLEFVAGTTVDADEATLNQLQIRHSIECIYTAEKLSDEQVAGVRLQFARRSVQRGGMDADNTWTPNLFDLPADGFRFLHRRQS